jgi:hypothetical protein
MLFTLGFGDFSAISDFVTIMSDALIDYKFVLLRVIDSEYVLPRAAEWNAEIHRITGTATEVRRSGLLAGIEVFNGLVQAGYFHGFDEVWMARDEGSFDQLENTLLTHDIGPYEAFTNSVESDLFIEELTGIRNIIGMLDGSGLNILTGDTELMEYLIARDTNTALGT